MSIGTDLRDLGSPLADHTDLGRAVGELLAGRTEPPALFALGEPTHGVAAFPRLRNELFAELVARGFRSIALEIDLFAAALVDDYIAGAAVDLDAVLATGFSHGFGAIPGNRELVEWLRGHNAGLAPQDRVRFHGFDAPVEFSAAPSPRQALSAVIGYLPQSWRPDTARDLEALLGDEDAWTDPQAMYEPAASIGASERVRDLRIAADDLTSVVRRAAPALRPTDPAAHERALAHARTAQGLLRYHAAMARPTGDRIAELSALRSEMMAENLLAIAAQEKDRGPTLVFAHNAHLRRMPPLTPAELDAPAWGNAGALVALALGERYLFVATDGSPRSTPGTLQAELARATTRRALFPAAALHAALPTPLPADAPFVRGHIPLAEADLHGADAVVFLTDTDGKQHRYW